MSHRSHARAGLSGLLAVGCFVAVWLLVLAGATQAASLPTVTLSVTPTSITVGGATQSGAVNIVSTAKGGKEPSPSLILLKPGVTPAEVYAVFESNKASQDPNVASKYGAIVFDTSTPPGKSSEAQTILQPGEYVAINAEGGKSAKWPRTSFTVTASPSPAALPAAQATERSIDFGFRGPTTLHDGELVRFENEGWLVHMDIAFPVKSAKAAKQAIKALLAGNEKKLEKLVAGEPVDFAGPLSTGGFQQEAIAAKPGWYVQACFMETQDGRDHTLLGMERAIKIVK